MKYSKEEKTLAAWRYDREGNIALFSEVYVYLSYFSFYILLIS